QVIGDLSGLQSAEIQGELFVVGGSEVYRAALPYCRDLYLTEVKKDAVGDRKFPIFEELFRFSSVLRDTPEMRIVHYINDEVRPIPRTRLEAPP
ncbi:MAG: dihydrofolate reductase, partial [Chthoniobacterales bacterium]